MQGKCCTTELHSQPQLPRVLVVSPIESKVSCALGNNSSIEFYSQSLHFSLYFLNAGNTGIHHYACFCVVLIPESCVSETI